jgi:tRNA-splicing ligase RtcB (3'-phosphate/5'-hydroxy nucleic acid ligase)
VSVPVKSKEGLQYFNAMSAAANYAWANRQVISGCVTRAFEEYFKKGAAELGMQVVYDVSHNIARMEKYEIDGVERLLCVHRKGATRALPAGHRLMPAALKGTGQPVLVPGDMGRASFILSGRDGAQESFYSSCHGAGRLMSRSSALKKGKGRDLAGELLKQGVIIRMRSTKLLAEEAPFAYKDAEDVTGVVEGAGLAKRVARMKPVAVIKG